MTDPVPETKEQAEKTLATLQRLRYYAEQAMLFDDSVRYQRMIDIQLERMRDGH